MKLALILADQLSDNLATLRALDRQRDLIIMAEVLDEACYVPHHPQKIAFLFSAMRHFAAHLQQQGWRVFYHAFDRQSSFTSLLSVVQHALHVQQRAGHNVEQLVLTQCGEYRLQSAINQHWSQQLGIAVNCLDDDRFICDLATFRAWAAGRKQWRMEYFYRQMRQQTGLLMKDGEPEGGQWNFDSDNRHRYDNAVPILPPLPLPQDDIDREVLALVAREFPQHAGQLASFNWATTRTGALAVLAHFVEHRLPHYGRYQDAMVYDQPYLFHSLLSPYLNCGLLTAHEVCVAAEAAYYHGQAPLNAVEGFIRQIIGWREYVRGVYWLSMPEYGQYNALQATTPLPAYFWHGNTQMACLSQCITTTLDNAYAHHIQRLMVIGNFALLAGLDSEAICEWYLAVYIDAYEWVELPNTLGMALHGDNGLMASKPYAASGNYIHKMSNYCQHCHYNVKTRTEHDSCPFNSLYWHFMQRHRERFQRNPRMSMVYRTFDKMAIEQQQALLSRAEDCLIQLENL